MNDIVAACVKDRRKLAIVGERWIGGATLDEVGRDLNLTRERVRQIEKELRKRIDSEDSLAGRPRSALPTGLVLCATRHASMSSGPGSAMPARRWAAAPRKYSAAFSAGGVLRPMARAPRLRGRNSGAGSSRGQRVEERGEVPLQELLAEAERLNVSESSLRAYADSGDLETVDGVVRKTDRVPGQLEADIQESRGLAFFDGAWHLLLDVNNDHLRGSGFGVPAGIAAEFGVPVGGEQSWHSRLGEVRLRVNRLWQASLSTIRRFPRRTQR